MKFLLNAMAATSVALVIAGCGVSAETGVKDPTREENPKNIKDVVSAGNDAVIMSEAERVTWFGFYNQIKSNKWSLFKEMGNFCKTNNGNPVYNIRYWEDTPRMDNVLEDQAKKGTVDTDKPMVCIGGNDAFEVEKYSYSFKITHAKSQEQGYALLGYVRGAEKSSLDELKESQSWERVFEPTHTRSFPLALITADSFCLSRGGELLIAAEVTGGKAIPSMQYYTDYAELEKKERYEDVRVSDKYFKESKLWCVNTDNIADEFSVEVRFENYRNEGSPSDLPSMFYTKGVKKSEIVR